MGRDKHPQQKKKEEPAKKDDAKAGKKTKGQFDVGAIMDGKPAEAAAAAGKKGGKGGKKK